VGYLAFKLGVFKVAHYRNLDLVAHLWAELRRLWRLVLSRRSQGGMLPWDRVTPIFNRWIPIARVLHPYPDPGQVFFHSGTTIFPDFLDLLKSQERG
jgi:hypothetical protein